MEADSRLSSVREILRSGVNRSVRSHCGQSVSVLADTVAGKERQYFLPGVMG